MHARAGDCAVLVLHPASLVRGRHGRRPAPAGRPSSLAAPYDGGAQGKPGPETGGGERVSRRPGVPQPADVSDLSRPSAPSARRTGHTAAPYDGGAQGKPGPETGGGEGVSRRPECAAARGT
ncbi:hypothetical protein GCM10010360_54680 [Streptomyces nogalater]